MIAVQISSMKQFMNHFLMADSFDIFLLEEGTLMGACSYVIEGLQHPEFYGPEEEAENYPTGKYDFVTWKSQRGFVFELIKGKHTPLQFKFVLHAMPEHVEGILSKGQSSVSPQDVQAFVLTIRYDGNKILLTTGTSFRTFLLDKEPDRLWDEALLKYLSKKEIAFEVL